MKKHVIDFFKRGFVAMGFGPIVIAIVFAILGATGVVDTLSVWEMVKGILTVSLMAFIAAGVTVVYQIERLPIIYATLIHGVALYLDYAIIYLVNGWLKSEALPFAIFSACFVLGYALVWVIVYLFIRKDVSRLNKRVG